MKKQNKFISCLLIMLLVLGSFATVFAATPVLSDVVGNEYQTQIGVLTSLEIIDGYPDGTFKPLNVVTRAEMAKMIIIALGLKDYAVGVSTFSDIAKDNWAQGFINYAAGLGIIKGYPDGTFKPNATVSYDEATAMIIRALGYTPESLVGEWPVENTIKAKVLGIFKDINYAGPAGVNRESVATLLYNALGCEIGSVNSDNQWVGQDDTMYARLEVQKINAAVIKGTEDSVINLRPYVGVYAETYLNNDDEIIAIVEKSTSLTVDKQTSTTIESDGVEYNLPTSFVADKFVNGVKTSTTSAIILDSIIAVDLSGKTIDTVYSVSTWQDANEFKYEADMLENDNLNGYKFTLDNNDAIDLASFELLGISKLSNLSKDDIVYVYTANNYITRIEVGTEVITGKVTRYSDKDKEYTIGGKVYYSYATNVSLGDTGTGLLDYYGDIYSWTVIDGTTDNYAVVIATAAGVSGFDYGKVKLYTKDDDTLIIDAKDASVFASAAAIAAGSLVTYSIDSNGDLDKINDLVSIADLTGKFSATGAIFDSKYIVNSNAVVFVKNGSVYTVGSIGLVDKNTEITLYDGVVDSDTKLDAIIVDIAKAQSADKVYGVINDFSQMLNTAGDKVQYIEGLANGKLYAAYTDDDNLISTSDELGLVEFTVSGDGTITAKTVSVTSVSSVTISTVTAIETSTMLVKDASNWYALDSNVAIYVYDSVDKVWEVKTITALHDLTNVKLYQIDKDSEQYDIVIAIN